ncbi:hypothetical protein BH10PLA2_BH10PLA2_04430 [soil metagenome]
MDVINGRTVRQFLTPISSDTLVFLSQSGWSASTILRLWVERLNGIPNASTASNPARGLIPDFARFQRIAELLQVVQDREMGSIETEEQFVDVSGPLPASAITATAAVEATKNGLEYRPKKNSDAWTLVRSDRRLVLHFFPGVDRSPEIVELQALLNLRPDQARYEVIATAGGVPDPLRVPSAPSAVLQLVPRSTAQVYFFLANGVEVPSEHLNCCPATLDDSGNVFNMQAVTRGLFEVHVAKGHKPPPCAYVAVRYRGNWFYIDEQDQASKTTFGLVMQLSRLDFKRQQLGAGPVLTLPAGR